MPQSLQQTPTPVEPETKPLFSVWSTPFYDHLHQKSLGTTPAFHERIAGALLGFDYTTSYCVVGAGVGASGSSIHYSESLKSHAHLNEEFGLAYASFQWNRFFLNATLWGGGYQLRTARNSPFSISSKSHAKGYLLSPHLEFSAAAYRKGLWTVEPFVMGDWVSSWQKKYTEKGASGFNLVVPRQYASLLRSEIGVRLYETLHYTWGELSFEEKASYVNLAPFQFNPVTTYFVGGAPSAFSVSTGSNKVQNLGSVQALISLTPKQVRYPFASMSFQGEWGSSYWSYLGAVELGWRW